MNLGLELTPHSVVFGKVDELIILTFTPCLPHPNKIWTIQFFKLFGFLDLSELLQLLHLLQLSELSELLQPINRQMDSKPVENPTQKKGRFAKKGNGEREKF
jgi:hypothetical protein